MSDLDSTTSAIPQNTRARLVSGLDYFPEKGPGNVETKQDLDAYLDFVVSRVEDNKSFLASRAPDQLRHTHESVEKLRHSFEDLRNSQRDTVAEPEESASWDFWASIVYNYAETAKSESEKLHSSVIKGIPPALRPIVWPIVASSAGFVSEEEYKNLLAEPSIHDRAIKRDLVRNSAVVSGELLDHLDLLFNVLKAYAVFDDEIGYNQGLIFIAGPLLLCLPEYDAFCLLATLMKCYGLKQLYTPEAPGLSLKLYQLDRLVGDAIPSLGVHLQTEQIKAHKYAIQWFLTLFGYKLAPKAVVRLLDLIITEGLDALQKPALAIMKKNHDKMIAYQETRLLEYLRSKLFDCYEIGDISRSAGAAEQAFASFTRIQPEIGGSATAAAPKYNIDELMADADDTKVTPLMLEKYRQEFAILEAQVTAKNDELDVMRTYTGKLRAELKASEAQLVVLRRQHAELANEVIRERAVLTGLEDEINDIEETNRSLQQQLEQLQLKEKTKPESHSTKDEILNIIKENGEILEQNRLLEDEYEAQENTLEELKREYNALLRERGAEKNAGVPSANSVPASPVPGSEAQP